MYFPHTRYYLVRSWIWTGTGWRQRVPQTHALRLERWQECQRFLDRHINTSVRIGDLPTIDPKRRPNGEGPR